MSSFPFTTPEKMILSGEIPMRLQTAVSPGLHTSMKSSRETAVSSRNALAFREKVRGIPSSARRTRSILALSASASKT